MSITHTIIRDDAEITIEATAVFHYGELEDWEFTSPIPVTLTQDEEAEIEEKLIDDKATDWDEDSWKAERDRS